MNLLIIRRYIISAAHCFCGNVIACDDATRYGKRKKEYKNNEDNPRIDEIGLQYMDGEMDKNRVDHLRIHPEYTQLGRLTVSGHTDVALIKTKRPIFDPKSLAINPYYTGNFP